MTKPEREVFTNLIKALDNTLNRVIKLEKKVKELEREMTFKKNNKPLTDGKEE